MSRIPPLTAPFDDAVGEALARWMPPGSPVEPLSLFRTLLRHGPLAEAMLPLGRLLLSKRATLTRRHRELLILRTCARLRCEYEWGVHATAFAAAVGFADADVEATRAAGVAATWDAGDALVVRLVDELVDGARLSDALWRELATAFTQEQVLELLVACGWYHVIAFVAHATPLAPAIWATRFA